MSFPLPLGRYTGVTVVPGTNATSPAATVTVYLTGTLVPAALYVDSAGATPLANPVTSDGVTGSFSFCVANGVYDITVTAVGVTAYTIPAVQIVYAGAPVGQLLVSTTVIPHAQILTLPTTPGLAGFNIVAAPGAGLTIVPLHVRLIADTRAGAYTNIDPGTISGTGGFVFVGLPNGTPDVFSYLTNRFAGGTGDTGQTLVTEFLGAVGQQLWEPPRYGAPKDPSDGATGPFFFNGWGLLRDPTIAPVTNGQNQPFQLAVTNGALGNFTGGNAANSLTVTVAYLIL